MQHYSHMRNMAIIALLYLLPTISSIAQGSYRLSIRSDSSETGLTIINGLKYTNQFATPDARNIELRDALTNIRQQGYLAASVDQVNGDSLREMTAVIRLGKQYKWAQLAKGNVDEHILNKTGFRDRLYYNRPLNVRQVNKLFRQIISYCENHGYPFASVRLDSARFEGSQLYAALHLEKNKEFRIDSIKVLGDAKIGVKYISNYLGIKTGDFYDQAQLASISSRIKELPFATESRTHEIIFTSSGTKLQIYLKHRKANGINGVLGVLPDEETGRITFTGDVKLNLQNPLGKGESIDFNWRRLQTGTQDLKTNVVIPFILSTPFGADLGFKLYRQDSAFTDLNRNVGIQYLLSGGNFFKAFVNWQSSNLVSTAGLQDVTVLPELLDVEVISYGIGLRSQKLDYRLNPRRGYRINLSGSVGNKTIKQNVDINPEIYDSLDLTTVQFRTEADLGFFLPLKKRSTAYFGLRGGWLESDNLFRNELYRIGGLKTLRGFDEESITASLYSVFTFELRYLLEQNSYAYLFWDGAYVENRSEEASLVDRPFGFGLGVSFETRAGIFSFSYALGKQRGNPILLRAAKLHFGFVTFI